MTTYNKSIRLPETPFPFFGTTNTSETDELGAGIFKPKKLTEAYAGPVYCDNHDSIHRWHKTKKIVSPFQTIFGPATLAGLWTASAVGKSSDTHNFAIALCVAATLILYAANAAESVSARRLALNEKKQIRIGVSVNEACTFNAHRIGLTYSTTSAIIISCALAFYQAVLPGMNNWFMSMFFILLGAIIGWTHRVPNTIIDVIYEEDLASLRSKYPDTEDL